MNTSPLASAREEAATAPSDLHAALEALLGYCEAHVTDFTDDEGQHLLDQALAAIAAHQDPAAYAPATRALIARLLEFRVFTAAELNDVQFLLVHFVIEWLRHPAVAVEEVEAVTDRVGAALARLLRPDIVRRLEEVAVALVLAPCVTRRMVREWLSGRHAWGLGRVWAGRLDLGVANPERARWISEELCLVQEPNWLVLYDGSAAERRARLLALLVQDVGEALDRLELDPTRVRVLTPDDFEPFVHDVSPYHQELLYRLLAELGKDVPRPARSSRRGRQPEALASDGQNASRPIQRRVRQRAAATVRRSSGSDRMR